MWKAISEVPHQQIALLYLAVPLPPPNPLHAHKGIVKIPITFTSSNRSWDNTHTHTKVNVFQKCFISIFIFIFFTCNIPLFLLPEAGSSLADTFCCFLFIPKDIRFTSESLVRKMSDVTLHLCGDREQTRMPLLLPNSPWSRQFSTFQAASWDPRKMQCFKSLSLLPKVTEPYTEEESSGLKGYRCDWSSLCRAIIPPLPPPQDRSAARSRSGIYPLS